MPAPLAPLLALCDGTRDLPTLRAGFELRTGLRLDPAVIEELTHGLDDALLLDNERFQEACAAALAEYRRAEFRAPRFAGEGYPAFPGELSAVFDGLCAQATAPSPGWASDAAGLISPHIDYARGGPVYAAVWSAAREPAERAELVVLLGTDHLGTQQPFVLTRQRYATPWGVLPTDEALVDDLAHALGTAAFEDELHHRTEHSVELAAVWLHYSRGGEPVPLLPVLCGPMGAAPGDSPPADERLARALEVLRQAIASRQTLIVAAGDLAHVGPAFGDALPIRPLDRARLEQADLDLLRSLDQGADAFFAKVAGEGDRRRVCGLPPIYAALSLLGNVESALLSYDQCSADDTGGSLVTIAGVLLKRR